MSIRRTRRTLLSARLGAAVALAIGALAPAHAQAPANAVQAAGIVDGNLVVRAGTGPTRIVHAGGAQRMLPVFSADGSRIAFVQATDRRQALADLVVVSEAGVELVRVPIEPVQADMAYAGMRFVEHVQWISADRVAVRGSLNPSQSQYYVIDVAAGKVVDDFIDDVSSAAFSPDGRHVAVQTGQPHFTSDDQRAPQIEVDGHAVYPGSGRHEAQIVAAPHWSPDSRSLAWVVQQRGAASPSLTVWREGALHETAIPVAPSAALSLHWAGSRVVVATAASRETRAPARAWSADAQGAGLKSVPAGGVAADPLAHARTLRDKLAGEARAAGLGQPDVWCRACGLEALPRASE